MIDQYGGGGRVGDDAVVTNLGAVATVASQCAVVRISSMKSDGNGSPGSEVVGEAEACERLGVEEGMELGDSGTA